MYAKLSLAPEGLAAELEPKMALEPKSTGSMALAAKLALAA